MATHVDKTLEHISQSRKGKIVVRRIGWAVLVFVIFLVLVVVAGATYQGIASAVDASTYPPPGRLVDVGGYRLHIHCTGSGGPTVILNAGNGGSSLDWSLVQPGVATFTRVCSYDRAGYGWSDPALHSARVGVSCANCTHSSSTQASPAHMSWSATPLGAQHAPLLLHLPSRRGRFGASGLLT